jgi:hypothetical protein
MRTLLQVILVVGITVPLAAATAAADPIKVVGGSVSVDTGDPPSFTLATADGHSYQGEGFSMNWPVSCTFQCPPGTVIPLSSTPTSSLDGSEFLGRDDGVTGFPQISLFLSAPSVTLVPDAGAPRGIDFFVPFTFTGQLAAFPTPALTGDPLFDVSLTGQGVAKLNLFVENGLYTFSSLDYNFQAPASVPEPGTLLLAGMGTALLWRRARVVRRRIRGTVAGRGCRAGVR